MFTPAQIDQTDIDQLKTDFLSIMTDVVVTYGDDQSLPVACPGQENTAISLPGSDTLPVSTHLCT